MNTTKITFLENYLSLYIDHHKVLANPEDYCLLDVRNAPKEMKKVKIKGAIELPAKDLADKILSLDKNKTYVVYDWTGGTILGKQALYILLNHGFTAFELAGALEGWLGMKLPVENI